MYLYFKKYFIKSVFSLTIALISALIADKTNSIAIAWFCGWCSATFYWFIVAIN